jgi:hypothetical protein
MPLDQFREGPLIPVAGEALQQQGVGGIESRRAHQRPQPTDNQFKTLSGHVLTPGEHNRSPHMRAALLAGWYNFLDNFRPVGQGFAPLGRMLRDPDVVKKIKASAADGQKDVTPPSRILKIVRQH